MKWHNRQSCTIFLYFMFSSLVTEFIIQVTETAKGIVHSPQTHTAGSMHWDADSQIEKLKDSIKIRFWLLFFLFASILARTCTPISHMSCNTNNICSPYKGQTLNDFSRIDNIERRTRWEWPNRAIACRARNTGAQHLNSKTPRLQGLTLGSSPLF